MEQKLERRKLSRIEKIILASTIFGASIFSLSIVSLNFSLYGEHPKSKTHQSEYESRESQEEIEGRLRDKEARLDRLIEKLENQTVTREETQVHSEQREDEQNDDSRELAVEEYARAQEIIYSDEESEANNNSISNLIKKENVEKIKLNNERDSVNNITLTQIALFPKTVDVFRKGKDIFLVERFDRRVFYDAKTGNHSHTFSKEVCFGSYSYYSGERLLATTCIDNHEIHDIKTGKMFLIPKNCNAFFGVDIGNKILINNELGEFYDLETNKKENIPKRIDGYISYIDNMILICTEGGYYDLKTQKKYMNLSQNTGEILKVGGLILIRSLDTFYDAKTGNEVFELSHDYYRQPIIEIRDKMLVQSSDCTKFFDLNKKETFVLPELPKKISHKVYDINGKLLVMTFDSKKLYNLETGELVFTDPENDYEKKEEIKKIFALKDKSLVKCGYDRFYDLETEELRFRKYTYSLELFEINGKKLLLCYYYERTLHDSKDAALELFDIEEEKPAYRVQEFTSNEMYKIDEEYRVLSNDRRILYSVSFE